MRPAAGVHEPASPRAISGALTDVAAIGPYFAIGVGDPGAGDTAGTWRPVADAFSAGLAELIESTAVALGTDEARVAASTVQLGYAARLWSPLLACAVIHHVVPDLTGLLYDRCRPVPLWLPDPSGWRSPDPRRLGDLVYRAVVVDHLESLNAALTTQAAAGLLWGNAGSALVGAARVLVAERPGHEVPIAELVGHLMAVGRLRGTGRIGPGLEFRRRTCCLYYRVPGGGKCSDCSLLKAE